MTDDWFDLSFDGTLAPGADPDDARRRLMAIFKLTESGAERLFTGRAVVVKRHVDAATAAQFRQVFADAGAVLRVVPVEPADAPDTPGHTIDDERQRPAARRPFDTSPLTLAPPGGLLEDPLEYIVADLDLSHLSLVPGNDWTLEDCEPPPMPIPEPDTSYLTLAEIENRDDSEEPASQWDR